MPCDELLVTEFDMNTTKGKSQIIKVLIPFLAPSEQRMIAIFVRIWELVMTIHYYENPATCATVSVPLSGINPQLLEDLKKYCTKENQEMIDMMLKFMNMSEIMKFMNVFDDMNMSGDMMSQLFSGDIGKAFNMGAFSSSGSSGSSSSSGATSSDSKSTTSNDLGFLMSCFDKSGLYKDFLAELDKKIN